MQCIVEELRPASARGRQRVRFIGDGCRACALRQQAIGFAFGEHMNDTAGPLVALKDPHRVLGVRRVEHEAHGRAETAGLFLGPARAAICAELSSCTSLSIKPARRSIHRVEVAVR